MGHHEIGRKRFENNGQIHTRDRHYQRRQVERAERAVTEPREAERPKVRRPTIPRTAAATVPHPPDDGRRMPHGVCPGCQEDGPLPPFGQGMCFICATDGPPGTYTHKGSALHEDTDARRAEIHWFDEGSVEVQVRDIFAEANGAGRVRWGNIGAEVAEEFDSLNEDHQEARIYTFVRESLGVSNAHGERTANVVAQLLIRHSNEWRAFTKAAGRCVQCRKDRGSNGTADLCRRCQDGRNARQREAYARRLRSGVCARCPRELFNAGLCRECYPKEHARGLDKNRKRIIARAAAGVCKLCPTNDQRPVAKGRFCKEHYESTKRYNRDRMAKHIQARHAAGLCVQCPRVAPTSAVDGGYHCAAHRDARQRSIRARKEKRKATIGAQS